MKTSAYGSSIPHIDAADILTFEVVRVAPKDEEAISDLAEESAVERARADVLDRELADDAGKLIEQFLAGDIVPFVTTMSATVRHLKTVAPKPLAEHSRVRLLRARPGDGLAAGAEGAIVHVYESGAGYEVEFVAGRPRPAVLTLTREEVEPVKDE